MPYISPKRVKEVRTQIRKEFPDFKFSIKCRNYSTIDITIKEGNLDLLSEKYKERGNEPINHFYIEEHYKDNPEKMNLLKRIFEISNEGNGTECEDGDYGTIPHFYINLRIGDYGEPYQFNQKVN